MNKFYIIGDLQCRHTYHPDTGLEKSYTCTKCGRMYIDCESMDDVYINIREVAKSAGGTNQYNALALKGLAGYPSHLGKGIRHRGDHHSTEIHVDDFQTFVDRLKDFRTNHD